MESGVLEGTLDRFDLLLGDHNGVTRPARGAEPGPSFVGLPSAIPSLPEGTREAILYRIAPEDEGASFIPYATPVPALPRCALGIAKSFTGRRANRHLWGGLGRTNRP